MKKFIRITALLLALMMVSAGFAGNTKAATSQVDLSQYTEGTGYIAFGDSITRGCGAISLEEWEKYGYRMDNYDSEDKSEDCINCRNVPNAYPMLVAEALLGRKTNPNILDKTEKYWPISANAVDTAFLCNLFGIDDDFCDDEYLHNDSDYPWLESRYKTQLHYFGEKNVSFAPYEDGRCNSDGTIMPISELVGNASLITIEIGLGDVLNRSREISTKDTDTSDVTSIANTIAKFVKYMNEGFEYWKKAYPLILDYFREKNPDCTVIIIGAINPIYNMTISDDLLLPLGDVLSAVTAAMNQYYRQWAEEYGYIFLDISNVETGTVENDTTAIKLLSRIGYEQNIATHPTATGHQQIARMILNALEQKESNARKTGIRIDLGRFESVTGVTLNGKTITDYTFENHILTIPTKYRGYTRLTITGTYNGRTAYSLYQLTYHNGYSAYRIYTSNDISKLQRKLRYK